ncbi:MAG: ACT domain-containing protein [Mycobacteriales bacterium]
MNLLAVTTLGDDRPGVIAAVSAVLLTAGCNIEESAMTRLRGEFAMMLVVQSPMNAPDLNDALRDVSGELGLIVHVRPASEGLGDSGGRLFTVSVYGADHPGIVHAVTTLLAARAINVVDVVTHVLDPDGTPVYVMALEVVVPVTTDVDEATDALAALAAEQGVDASMRPVESETL